MTDSETPDNEQGEVPEDADLTRTEVARREEEHKARAAGQAVAMVYDGDLAEFKEEHGTSEVASESAGPTALLTTQEVRKQFEKGFKTARENE